MADIAQDWIDLLAGGNEAQITCVLTAALGSTVTFGLGGLYAGGAVGAGVGAIVGLYVGVRTSHKVCGAGTEGGFKKLFQASAVPPQLLQSFAEALNRPDLGPDDVRFLAGVAHVALQRGAPTSRASASEAQVNAAIEVLLRQRTSAA